MATLYHLLGLHMHQPPGNREFFINSYEWEAKQIMLCYDRPLKYAWRYQDVATFYVGFSGILLEQRQDPKIVARYADVVDIPQVLARYRRTPHIEIIGMDYYHPIFPLISMEDWDDQISRANKIIQDVFGREPRIVRPPKWRSPGK